jgi:hypothetical protein
MMIEQQIERVAADIQQANGNCGDAGNLQPDVRLVERAERHARRIAMSMVEHLDGRPGDEGEDVIDVALERVLERLLSGRRPVHVPVLAAA